MYESLYDVHSNRSICMETYQDNENNFPYHIFGSSHFFEVTTFDLDGRSLAPKEGTVNFTSHPNDWILLMVDSKTKIDS